MEAREARKMLDPALYNGLSGDDRYATMMRKPLRLWAIQKADGVWTGTVSNLGTGDRANTPPGSLLFVLSQLAELGLKPPIRWIPEKEPQIKTRYVPVPKGDLKQQIDETPEYVYLIGEKPIGIVKIGKAVSVQRRLGQLQRMSPTPLKLLWCGSGGGVAEAHFHKVFSEFRKHGEWFDFGQQDARKVIVAEYQKITRRTG